MTKLPSVILSNNECVERERDLGDGGRRRRR